MIFFLLYIKKSVILMKMKFYFKIYTEKLTVYLEKQHFLHHPLKYNILEKLSLTPEIFFDFDI